MSNWVMQSYFLYLTSCAGPRKKKNTKAKSSLQNCPPSSSINLKSRSHRQDQAGCSLLPWGCKERKEDQKIRTQFLWKFLAFSFKRKGLSLLSMGLPAVLATVGENDPSRNWWAKCSECVRELITEQSHTTPGNNLEIWACSQLYCVSVYVLGNYSGWSLLLHMPLWPSLFLSYPSTKSRSFRPPTTPFSSASVVSSSPSSSFSEKGSHVTHAS